MTKLVDELDESIDDKADKGKVDRIERKVHATGEQLEAMDTDVIVQGAAVETLERRIDRQVRRSELQQLSEEVSRVTQSVATLSARDIDSLRRDNQTLRAENQALRRHIARTDVRANLTRLTPTQTLEALQVYCSMNESAAGSRSFVRNQAGEVTHLRSWTGLRRSLPNMLRSYHPNGGTLQEFGNFLARQGLAVQDPATLENAVFAVLGIAEPAPQS